MARRDSDKFMLRLPDGWREVIKSEAKSSHRTMNAEILAAIEVAMRLKGTHLPEPS